MFIKFGGDVLLGGAILVIGFWLANVAHDAIQARETTQPGLAASPGSRSWAWSSRWACARWASPTTS